MPEKLKQKQRRKPGFIRSAPLSHKPPTSLWYSYPTPLMPQVKAFLTSSRDVSSGLLEETINRILDEWGVLLPCRVCLLAEKHSPDEERQKSLADPPRLVPKRTTKMLNLSKEDGVCKYVVRREEGEREVLHKGSQNRVLHPSPAPSLPSFRYVQTEQKSEYE
ncbi:hypothetical protein ARMGADRAFT_1115372 [Armillaria gallica]|uniref:Uncharacterized protein n=1 Tax=Armillaria gallica TaxID=47427 RepID=A0A2H3DNV0_ARMGA|nr:hypothetical protein ARMGADRAFT_1115372 [Armillaria gallica]